MTKNDKPGRTLNTLLTRWSQAVAGTALPQPPSYGGRDIQITHITENSKEVTPGACFVARVRETSDGHPYIAQAVDRGARLIIAQKPAQEVPVTVPEEVVYLQVADTAVTLAWLAAAWEEFPGSKLVVIGITGTDGKTTTANILLSMLRAAGFATGLLSTTRAVIGSEEEPLALHVTTPEAPVIQHHLRRMVDAGLTHCILEATSHGLAQHRVGAIPFDLAVITNITHEHLDYHGDFENYAAAKAMLFTALTGDPWPARPANPIKAAQVKTAVLNRDDNAYDLLSKIPAPRQFDYAIYHPASVRASDITYAPGATQLTLHIGQALTSDVPLELTISSPLAGEFNVYNSLAAVTAALAVGAPAQAVVEGLENLEPISGRMERIDAGQPFQVLVDFAHTPNALQQALKAARRMASGRIIAVFGSAGKRDVAKRSQMARISAQLADLTVLTAEDPRTESLAAILQAMAEGSASAGGIEGESFWRIPDRGRAIHFALSLARPGDLVLISGKGHEQSMCFGVTEYPWDDRQATLAALRALINSEPIPDSGLPTFEG